MYPPCYACMVGGRSTRSEQQSSTQPLPPFANEWNDRKEIVSEKLTSVRLALEGVGDEISNGILKNVAYNQQVLQAADDRIQTLIKHRMRNPQDEAEAGDVLSWLENNDVRHRIEDGRSFGTDTTACSCCLIC